LESACNPIAHGILMVENNVIRKLLWYTTLCLFSIFCYMTSFFELWQCFLICVIMQVTTLIDQHNCSSSARRLTTTPTAGWVVSTRYDRQSIEGYAQGSRLSADRCASYELDGDARSVGSSGQQGSRGRPRRRAFSAAHRQTDM
jgi:hypothetical protein